MFSGAGRSVLGMNSSTNRDRDWHGGSETQISRPCSAISVERDPFLENTAKERNAFYSSFYRDSPASTIAAGLQINTGGSNMPALTLSRPSSASSTAMFTPRSPSHITTKSPTHSLGHNTHYHPYSGGTTGPNGAQLNRRPSSGRANGLNVINSSSSYVAPSKSTSGSNKHASQAQYLLNAGSVSCISLGFDVLIQSVLFLLFSMISKRRIVMKTLG